MSEINPKISTPDASDKIKSLIYGPAGNGKTRLLGTANRDPRTAPILVLDYEGGTASLKGMTPKVDVFRVRSWQDFNEAYAILADPHCPYKSVGLDSVSETHIFALMTLLDKPSSQKSRKIPDLLEQGDYGIALVQMRRLLRAFRDLDLHVFATALDKTDVDPREGTIKRPSLAGAMADEILGIFDVVGYLGLTAVAEPSASGGSEPTVTTHRVLVLQNYPKLRTKVRAPEGIEVPDELWDPTVTSLLDLLGYE